MSSPDLVKLSLTSDDLERHIVVNVSSTLTNNTIWFVAALCFIVDVRTYVCTDGWTFLPGLLSHLSGDDLKIPGYTWEPCPLHFIISLFVDQRMSLSAV